MRRFHFMAATALGLLLAAPAPGLAADVILLPGTGPGEGGGGLSAPRQVHAGPAVGGAQGAGLHGGRAPVGDGAGVGTVNELLAVGALTRSQAATFRASIRRIASAQAAGRPDQVTRARISFRTIVERFVRTGVLSRGTAQLLLEAV